MNAAEFHSNFESTFAAGASAARLVRERGRTPKWKYQATDGTGLTVGFRLNRKNLAGYPGEFMPDICWSGPQSGARDTGEVSFYQYTSPSETRALAALQRSVIEKFVTGLQQEGELSDPHGLVRLLAEACEREIRPHHHRWLPYWDRDDATAWGELFGASMAGWIARFFENPETLEAWCQRVLWSKP